MSKTTPPSARLTAARFLARVFEQGCSLESLSADLAQLSDSRERALAQRLCYGVLRWLPRLEFLLNRLLRQPLKKQDQDIHALLLIGLYQLLYLQRIPEYAATAATVEAAYILEKKWAVPLINGVLRNFHRQRRALSAAADQEITARWAHLRWWLSHFQADWPAEWEQIAERNNEEPPLTLRVNCRKITRQDYQEQLRAIGLAASPTQYAPQGLTLAEPVEVQALPGFAAGLVSVQDEAAQLAAALLQVQPGMRVLDACAAPGGKTAHLLELTPDAEVLALEQSAARLTLLGNTLQRLELTAQTQRANAADLKTWWRGQLFDRILLDAPCSGSGVIRRHPDIKYLRRDEDIPRLAARQQQLLTTLWQTLAPGGMLLYASCSLLKIENERQILRFLTQNPEAQTQEIAAPWGHPLVVGRQILPGEQGMDGFYYALLCKK